MGHAVYMLLVILISILKEMIPDRGKGNSLNLKNIYMIVLLSGHIPYINLWYIQ